MLVQSISDKEKKITGIPLQTRMLAEAFQKEVETYFLSQRSEPELPKQLCLVDLYKKLIEEKINIFKSKGEIAEEQQTDNILSDISITKNHQKLALDTLLPELKDTVLKLEECDLLAPEAISRIGIVQYIDDKPHFIHRTFAEYYVADFLATQLTKENHYLLEVLKLLFRILLCEENLGIRNFLDGLLGKTEKSKVIKQYEEQIYKIWTVKKSHKLFQFKKEELTRESIQTALLQAAAEGSAHIIHFFFSSLKSTGNSNTINELLLHKDIFGKNAWELAARVGQLKTLRKLWDWGRELHVNLKDELLLAKDSDGQTAWDIAEIYSNREILETLWVWGRKVQVNLKNDLLLAKGRDGLTAWHRAAIMGKKEILVTLWRWGRDVQVNHKDDLLLAKSKNGLTAWEIAAISGNKEILETLWFWGRELQVNLKDDLLLAKGFDGRTAWEIAAWNGRKEILEILWCWGRKVQINLKDDLLLAKGRKGLTAWDIASCDCNKEILETLCVLGREVRVNLKDNLLLAKVRDGLKWINCLGHCSMK